MVSARGHEKLDIRVNCAQGGLGKGLGLPLCKVPRGPFRQLTPEPFTRYLGFNEHSWPISCWLSRILASAQLLFEVIFQAVGFCRVESWTPPAGLPLVGLAAEKSFATGMEALTKPRRSRLIQGGWGAVARWGDGLKERKFGFVTRCHATAAPGGLLVGWSVTH